MTLILAGVIFSAGLVILIVFGLDLFVWLALAGLLALFLAGVFVQFGWFGLIGLSVMFGVIMAALKYPAWSARRMIFEARRSCDRLGLDFAVEIQKAGERHRERQQIYRNLGIRDPDDFWRGD